MFGVICVLFITFLVYVVSWLTTCGIIKLLSLCFGFAFTWKLATGMWLVLCLLRWVISAAKSEK